MGVLYHAEYIHIFERSRGEFSRKRNLAYAEIEKGGIMLPVCEVQCRYRSPARYDDLVSVEVGITEWRKASLRFSYRMWLDNTLLAEASTLHACTNLQAKPQPWPAWLEQAFRP